MKHDRISILLMGMPLASGNRGIRALLHGSVAVIDRAFPEGKLFLLALSGKVQEETIEIGTRSVLIQSIALKSWKRFYSLRSIAVLLVVALFSKGFHSVRATAFLSRSLPGLRELGSIDLALSMRGGDSFSDIYGMSKFIAGSLPIITLILLERKVVFLPQTIGPFRTSLSLWMAKWILSRVDRIHTRDLESIHEMKRCFGEGVITEKTVFNYDVGFLLEPRKPRELNELSSFRRNRNSLSIGFNVSGLLYRGGYSGKNQFGLRCEYKQLVRELILWLRKRHGASVLLIPHVFGRQWESDVVACEELYAEMRKECSEGLFCLKNDYNEKEIKFIIGECDFLLGSRMHACIAALSQGVPALALAYSRKFKGVYGTIGMERLVVDLREAGLNEVLESVEGVLSERATLRVALANKMMEVETSLLTMLEDFR